MIRNSSRRKRNGHIVVLFAMMLIFFVAILALAIDVGYIYKVQGDLQRSVDAGTLAGVGSIVDGPEAAEKAVIEYIQRNEVGGKVIPVEDMVIETGHWDTASRTFQSGGDLPSAVRVQVDSPNHPFFFGRVFQRYFFDVGGSATARYQPREIVVVLDYSGSMNDDSEFRHISSIGQANVEANLWQIYNELGAPTFGRMQWQPVYISTTNTTRIKQLLGLTTVPYPYPSGSWNDYINYVKSSGHNNNAGYRRKYGYLNLVNYWLERRPKKNQTPDLWKTSEQPITAVKNGVQLFLAYIAEGKTDDRVGLSVYTSANGTAKLESGLTADFQLIEDLSRQRQAAHYHSMTNIGAGLREARLELENNARLGAFKMIVLMTDGIANLPSGNANGYLLSEAQLCADKKYPVVTISLGAGADVSLMQQVADMTNGFHFNIPGGQSVAEYEEELKDAFREIAGHRPLMLVQ